jgi:hypothetical protein
MPIYALLADQLVAAHRAELEADARNSRVVPLRPTTRRIYWRRGTGRAPAPFGGDCGSL